MITLREQPDFPFRFLLFSSDKAEAGGGGGGGGHERESRGRGGDLFTLAAFGLRMRWGGGGRNVESLKEQRLEDEEQLRQWSSDEG